MPEMLVINPVKRRRARRKNPARRSAAQRAATRRMLAANRARNPARRHHRRARRHNPITAAGVRRHARRYVRRVRRAVSSYRRRRRNPVSMGSLFRTGGVMGMVKSAMLGGVGAFGMDWLMSKINPMLPASLQPAAVGNGIGINDVVRLGVTVLAGRALSRPTRGASMKMAEGALVVQAYNLISVLGAQYIPTAMAGVGYATPTRVIPGTARISPIGRQSMSPIAAGRMAAFLPRGTASPMLSAFMAPGTRGPLLAAGDRTRQRESIKYR